MIVFCEECGKRYQVDPGKITGNRVEIECRACGFLMTISANPRNPVERPEEGNGEDGAADSDEDPDPAAEADAGTPRSGRGGFGISLKISIGFLLAGLLSFLLAWGGILVGARDLERSGAETAQARTLAGLGSEADGWIEKRVLTLRLLAEGAENRWGREGKSASVDRPIPFPWNEGILVFSGPDGRFRTPDGRIPADRDLLEGLHAEIADSGQGALVRVLAEPGRVPMMIAAVPVPREKGRPGFLAGFQELGQMAETLRAGLSGNPGALILLNEKMASLRKTAPGENLSGHPLVAAMTRGERGPVRYRDVNGTPMTGQAIRTNYGIWIGIEQPDDTILAKTGGILAFPGAVLGPAILLFLLLAVIAGRIAGRPLRRLSRYAERISLGHAEPPVTIRSRDELGILAEAIRRMDESIRLALERLAPEKRR